MKTILVPLDLSASATKVCAAARVIAEAMRGRVVLLHVMQPPPVVINEYNAVDAAQLAAVVTAGRNLGLRRLGKFAAKLRVRGRAAKTLHETGSPVSVILEQARLLKADYIVLGSHGHGALYDLVAGSTALGVLKRATCPVLVVPTIKKKPTRR